MNTPIYDFVKAYRDLRPARFHMPGHKGRGPLGCEDLDLTEIPGADSLYEAAGIIAESEANASRLFGCPTFYSAEGSSHCIRAMLQVAREACQGNRQQATGNRERGTETGRERIATASVRTGLAMTGSGSFRVLAGRNVHSAFLTAAALLDLDVVWLPTNGDGSYLSAHPTPELLDAALAEAKADAVYLTCPDYLGFLPDLRPLAEVCHAHGALLLVDNAHGAYLRFLSPSRHPMDLGADLCCDSAHKTLPVLTGGAYLHVKATGNRQQATEDGGCEAAGNRRCEATGNRQQATEDGGCEAAGKAFPSRGRCPSAHTGADEVVCETGITERTVRDALALFGSTSPSYLILQSLDLANPWLEALPEKLAAFLPKVEALKSRLRAAGWEPVGDEPLKLTLKTGDADCRDQCAHWSRNDRTGILVPEAGGQWPPLREELSPVSHGSGLALAAALEQEGIFCEFADPDYIVFMLSPEHTEEELERLEAALIICKPGSFSPRAGGQWPPLRAVPEAVCTLREAMLSPAVTVPASESLGRVLARPGVSCPPAVPILMPGERIDEAAVAAFKRYGIESVSVLF